MAQIEETAPLWLRMGDEDRAKYGGEEWIALDVAKLYNAPSSILEQLEEDMPIPLFMMIRNLLTYSSIVTRAALYVARRQSGVMENWKDFDPQTMHVSRRDERPKAPKANGAGRGKDRSGSETSPRGLKEERSEASLTTSAHP